MTAIEIFILALALAADAFSVGVAVGITHRKPRQIFRLSWHFGLFQSLMLFLGAMTGKFIITYTRDWDHWVAFALLAFIGLRMIRESFHEEKRQANVDLTKGFFLIGLSTAVSIDAFAAGISLIAVNAPLIFSIACVGVVASLATVTAMLCSGKIQSWIGRKSEFIAGIVLIALGIKMLFTV